MGLPQSSNSPHLYPQALQLKLYQAFIFSIPILFSIILFLLFYLFYLKRRAYNLSSSTSILPTRSDHQPTPYVSSNCLVDLKGELKDHLPVVLFDEELRKRDSQCCVCLGDFEIKQELLQVPSCKHVFHIDCIHHWLHTNTSCPLCRCSVIPTFKLCNPTPPPVPEPQSSTTPQTVSAVEELTSTSTTGPPMAMARDVEESSGSTSRSSRGSRDVCGGNETAGYPERESVVIHIQTVHNS